jgi:hypothetical protein
MDDAKKKDGESQQYPSCSVGTNTQEKATWQSEQPTKRKPQSSRSIHIGRAKGALGVVVHIWPCGLVPGKESIISVEGALLFQLRQHLDLAPIDGIPRVQTRTTHDANVVFDTQIFA